jgi:gliding motility-associated-like protein
MKAKPFLKSILHISFLLLLSINTYGQKKFVSSSDVFGRRVFIKNNGQFDKIIPNNPIVDYVYSKDDEQVFFNKQGVTYLLQKKYKLTHSQLEALEHGGKVKPKPSKKAFVYVNWENSNPNVELVVSEKQSNYQSFGDEKYKSDCYKKITYKNLYPNIDIEYLFTEEREYGIKYNVIVHPGGNVNDIKIKYSGDVNKIKLKNGNVIIKTPVLNIIEIAPSSFQNTTEIESSFKLTNNLISFNVINYDHSKELTIDPWVVNIAFSTNNLAFDVDYDFSGNLFIFGGTSPFLISKFSPTGSLLWTFSGDVPSISWNSSPNDDYVGNFIVDKVSGETYIGQGLNVNGTQIIRLNTSGIYDNFVSAPDPNWYELWDMGYRCSDGAIFGLGGTIQNNTTAGILNTTTGVILPQNFSGLPGFAQDVVSHAIDPNGDVFGIFASVVGTPVINNTIFKINATFNGNDWLVPSQYTSFDEVHNKSSYSGNNINSNGYNALAANSDYLYYYDGYNLAVYNKLAGNRIAFTTIAGQIPKKQGGIAVDECNNIYVGGNGFVKCFNFDGSIFTSNGNIPVDAITTNKYITDIKLKSNELYVCGNGFVGVYSAINSLSCSSNAAVNVTLTTISTNNTTATATVTTSVTNPSISYTWLNSSNAIVSQTNNSNSLTNTVLNLTNDTYTVLIQLNGPCGLSSTQTFITGSTTTVTPTFTQVAAICYGAPLAALPTTSNNGIIGTWSPALDNTQTTTYTFIPTAGQNATTATMQIIVNPNTTPTFAAINPICTGDFLATLPTTSINGISGTWAPTLDNTQTTTYTFTPNSGGICLTTSTVTITVKPKVIPTFTPVDPICFGETAPVLPTTSLNLISGTWQPATINNTVSGIYQFSPTTGQCFIMPPPLQVTVYESFDFKITGSCIDKDFILEVTPLASSFDINTSNVTWYNSNNTVVTSNSPTFNVTEYLAANSIIPQLPITFSAIVELANNCKLTHSIVIDDLFCGIQKGITPNGDELNDFFDLQLLDVKKLSIFNRYGMKVYSQLNYTKQWKGQSDSGKELPDGTYYYVIEFNTNEKEVTGWIYINRKQ